MGGEENGESQAQGISSGRTGVVTQTVSYEVRDHMPNPLPQRQLSVPALASVCAPPHPPRRVSTTGHRSSTLQTIPLGNLELTQPPSSSTFSRNPMHQAGLYDGD